MASSLFSFYSNAVSSAASRRDAMSGQRSSRTRRSASIVAASRSSSRSSTSPTSTKTKKPSSPSLPTLALPSLSFSFSLPKVVLPTFSSSSSGKAKVARAKEKLLSVIADSERGTKTASAASAGGTGDVQGPSRADVEAAIDELYAVAPRSCLFPSEKEISGRWRLVWTSEREVLWLIENSKKVFGANIGEVFQTLSLSSPSPSSSSSEENKGEARPELMNEVVFPPGGLFVVNSSAKVRGSDSSSGSDKVKGKGKENVAVGTRVDFKFSSARLDVAKVVDEDTGEFAPSFSLPLPPFGRGWFDTVVVDDVRIARDVRGDTLICVRDDDE